MGKHKEKKRVRSDDEQGDESIASTSRHFIVDSSPPRKKKKKAARHTKQSIERDDMDQEMDALEDSGMLDASRDKPVEAKSSVKKGKRKVVPLDQLSPEQRRKAKGKGKMQNPVVVVNAASPIPPTKNSELARIKKELKFKDEIIAAHADLLSTIRTTIACTICLETLDRPFSLGCGHLFCRKCLINWFHRPDTAVDRDGGEDQDDEGSESDSNAADEEDSDIEEIPRFEEEVHPRRRTIAEQAEEESSDDDEDLKYAMKLSREMMASSKHEIVRGTLGNDQVIDLTNHPSGSKILAHFFGESSEGEEEGPSTTPALDAMRAARLQRFGMAKGEVTATADASDAIVLSDTSSESSNHPVVSAPAIPAIPVGVARPRSPSIDYVDPPNHSPPTGQHRINNLVCPQCRDLVSIAPHRIFVLAEIISLIRTAEADGTLAPAEESDHPTTTANRVLPGMKDTDLTWGGLFSSSGEETYQHKRDRTAVIMRDNSDRVYRCGHCNWEVDQTGLCEGCGREWEIPGSDTDDDGERVEGNSDGINLMGGDTEESENGSESEEDEFDDGFIVKDDYQRQRGRASREAHSSSSSSEEEARRTASPSPPRKRKVKRKLTIVSSDDSESDEEVIVARSHPRVIIGSSSPELESLGRKNEREERSTTPYGSDEEKEDGGGRSGASSEAEWEDAENF